VPPWPMWTPVDDAQLQQTEQPPGCHLLADTNSSAGPPLHRQTQWGARRQQEQCVHTTHSTVQHAAPAAFCRPATPLFHLSTALAATWHVCARAVNKALITVVCVAHSLAHADMNWWVTSAGTARVCVEHTLLCAACRSSGLLWHVPTPPTSNTASMCLCALINTAITPVACVAV
jgi:hypothetical protein